jgi:phosphate-selective porin OprO and OprP
MFKQLMMLMKRTKSVSLWMPMDAYPTPNRLLFIFATWWLMATPAWAIEAPKLSADLMYDSNQFDGALFDEVDPATADTHFLRRLKISAEMDILDRLSAELSYELDTDDNQFKVDDAFLTYEITKKLDILLGRFKEPFGLENLQSLKTMYVMERSSPTNLMTFGRHDGVGLHYHNNWWTAQSALMTIPSDDEDFDDASAYVGRITIAPIHRKKRFIHLGAGFTQRDATDGKYQLESNLIARSAGDLVKSARYDARSITAMNTELAAQYSPILIQAEYLQQKIDTENEGDILLDGGYFTVMWTAIGRSRKYDQGRIKFDPSKHTVELAYRYSVVNLTGEIKGDAAKVHELAINYYLNQSIKCVLQYESAERKDWSDEGILQIADGDSLNFRIQLLLE